MTRRTQEQRRAETRALLLDAAAELFGSRGFHATPADAVASRAQRTTGALYDHFGSKEGLLVAVLEEWIRQTFVQLAVSVEGEREIEGRLGELWRGLKRRDSESGDAWLLLEFELWLHAVRDPELNAVGAARIEAMRTGLADALSRWSAEFEVGLPSPPAEISMLFIALLVGAAFQHHLDPASVPDDVVVDGFRRLLGVPEPAIPFVSRSQGVPE